jgi:acyl-CoA thioesterase-1
MEALEDDADVVAPQTRPGIVVERPEILAGNLDAARGGALQAARHHHQAGFAGAGGADDGRNFANGDVESDAAQDIDRAGIACHVEMDVGEADDRLAGVGRDGQAGSERENMNLRTGYGRFAAAVNSLLIAILWLGLCLLGANAQTAPIKLAILGDSLAAGYGVSPAQAMPARLEAALQKAGRNVAIINHGVSGDTTAGGLQRIDWMLADKPDIVMVELGANDALRATDPAVTEKNLDAIIAKLKEAGVTVWLAGMLAPRNYGPEYAKQFDGLYQRLADKHGVPLYAFFLDGVAQDPALNQGDGIHPNPKGVDVIVERILPFATKNLDDFAASAHAPPVRRPARP